jgi:hypothetical protein
VKRFLIYKVVAPSGVMSWIESSSESLLSTDDIKPRHQACRQAGPTL